MLEGLGGRSPATFVEASFGDAEAALDERVRGLGELCDSLHYEDQACHLLNACWADDTPPTGGGRAAASGVLGLGERPDELERIYRWAGLAGRLDARAGRTGAKLSAHEAASFLSQV